MLSKDEIKHIAALARVGLADPEIPKYQKDLSAILDYFSQLQELKTDGIDPIGHITGMENATREDREADFGQSGKEKIIGNAPETKKGFVKVKSVF